MPRSRAERLASPAAQLGLLLGAFVVATLIARAFGDGWGTAAAFGQMAFALTLVALLLRVS